MLERLTVSNYSESTSKVSGIDTHNYSVDALRKAAFVDEINNVLNVHNPVDKDIIVGYLKNRIAEIDKRYK